MQIQRASELGGRAVSPTIPATRVASGPAVVAGVRSFAPLTGSTAGEGEDRPLCEQVDPELFFPAGRGDTDKIREAKAVCARCPFDRFQACREEAIDEGDRWAIRGGLTPRERLRYAPRRVA